MAESKSIAFASDHAGYEMKLELIKYLEEKGYSVKDFGTNSTESCDYTDYAHPMAEAVANGTFTQAISLCGSGNGISITLNKHNDVRAAICWLPELAALARQHNDANICSIPARFVSLELAKEIVDNFLSAEFEGGRHQKRVDKINWTK